MSFLLRLAHDHSLRVLKSKSGVTDGSVEGGTTPPEIVLLNQIQTLSTQILKKKEKDERKKRRAQKAKEKAKAAGANSEDLGDDSNEDNDDDDDDDDDDGRCAITFDEKEKSHSGVNF